MAVQFQIKPSKYKNINSATTTLVKGSAGILRKIIINTTVAFTIQVYDGLTAGGTLVATLKASIAEGHYIYDLDFRTGICIVTNGAGDITVAYE